MHLHSFRVKNFRRLKDVRVELEPDKTIFVGANNSGKTSAAHVLQLFLSTTKIKFCLYDFSADCWAIFNEIGDASDPEVKVNVPTISIDLWFAPESSDLHLVLDFLPNLDWAGTYVGIRIEFGPKSLPDLLARYHEAKAKSDDNMSFRSNGSQYRPWPTSMVDYLEKCLNDEYELIYYKLDDSKFDNQFNQTLGYMPERVIPSPGKESAGKAVAKLIRVDCLGAQRHLSDNSEGSRAEDLSRRLSNYYSRNLAQRGEDFDALKALVESESQMNEHLGMVFEPTLKRLSSLGYPGISSPNLIIKSALNPASLMSSQSSTTVHYDLSDRGQIQYPLSLPDRYNGLGYKNLIYMVVELLDLHARWVEMSPERPPVHLIVIEEPEVHLHAQLQQVFIRKVFEILGDDESEDAEVFRSQLIVTTHSPHILYEAGFVSIRYFRRGNHEGQTSEVLNLSAFRPKPKGEVNVDLNDDQEADLEEDSGTFLERYMKLTHCDLFFADAAILVEGNVERLLMPLMIAKVSGELPSAYLSVLEIGGAFGHKFRKLIHFLGITTLVITDLDSVNASVTSDEDADETEDCKGAACLTSHEGAVTSNQTLIKWLPGKNLVHDLVEANDEQCCEATINSSRSNIRVTYQRKTSVKWQSEVQALAGRTFEESFALENLSWCLHPGQKALGLNIRRSNEKNIQQLHKAIYDRVRSSSFDKTDFALSLLVAPIDDWEVPSYIKSGLQWLEQSVRAAYDTMTAVDRR